MSLQIHPCRDLTVLNPCHHFLTTEIGMLCQPKSLKILLEKMITKKWKNFSQNLSVSP